MSRREAREVVMVERESSSPVWWLLVGGAVGAGLALLFAPQPGDKTRRTLSRKLAGLRESAEAMIDEFRDAEPGDEAGDEAEAEEETEEEVEVLNPAEGARAELEKRLAVARARRQRALAEEDAVEPVA